MKKTTYIPEHESAENFEEERELQGMREQPTTVSETFAINDEEYGEALKFEGNEAECRANYETAKKNGETDTFFEWCTVNCNYTHVPYSETTVSESKHTKGEWKWKQSSGNNIYAHKIYVENKKTIALLDGNNSEEEKANAQRIVTSVNSFDDMLEALKLTYDLLSVGQPLGNDDLDKIHSAIAKANNSK